MEFGTLFFLCFAACPMILGLLDQLSGAPQLGNDINFIIVLTIMILLLFGSTVHFIVELLAPFARCAYNTLGFLFHTSRYFFHLLHVVARCAYEALNLYGTMLRFFTETEFDIPATQFLVIFAVLSLVGFIALEDNSEWNNEAVGIHQEPEPVLVAAGPATTVSPPPHDDSAAVVSSLPPRASAVRVQRLVRAAPAPVVASFRTSYPRRQRPGPAVRSLSSRPRPAQISPPPPLPAAPAPSSPPLTSPLAPEIAAAALPELALVIAAKKVVRFSLPSPPPAAPAPSSPPSPPRRTAETPTDSPAPSDGSVSLPPAPDAPPAPAPSPSPPPPPLMAEMPAASSPPPAPPAPLSPTPSGPAASAPSRPATPPLAAAEIAVAPPSAPEGVDIDGRGQPGAQVTASQEDASMADAPAEISGGSPEPQDAEMGGEGEGEAAESPEDTQMGYAPVPDSGGAMERDEDETSDVDMEEDQSNKSVLQILGPIPHNPSPFSRVPPKAASPYSMPQQPGQPYYDYRPRVSPDYRANPASPAYTLVTQPQRTPIVYRPIMPTHAGAPSASTNQAPAPVIYPQLLAPGPAYPPRQPAYAPRQPALPFNEPILQPYKPIVPPRIATWPKEDLEYWVNAKKWEQGSAAADGAGETARKPKQPRLESAGAADKGAAVPQKPVGEDLRAKLRNLPGNSVLKKRDAALASDGDAAETSADAALKKTKVETGEAAEAADPAEMG
ncbi:hypothetical protein B0A55_07026 [Friedmanniomyces simplex]|uniref:Uncharacterized protein n=1 Tax=Friedmanniomyces simplex TaxID=329884 RepID=A0A4U0XAR0_9PEZI|nr:hypothetical protein B0A55_07026 [Friedmanniomyces simplex]